MAPSLSSVRDRAGTELFLRVAGPDGIAERDRIHLTPGPRWYLPGSPIRTVHGDASMFVGGMRALLLQSLHPAAMAAVAAHSGYKGDPWGRLARTSTFLAVTTFGTSDDAQAAIDRVRAVHERISGTTPEGLAYAASDPALLRWVHVAEVDSFLRAYRLYGQRPIDAVDADRYVAQAARVAVALGAERVPTSVSDLALALREYRPVLGPSAAAREAAEFLLHEPPVHWTLRPAYASLARAAVASLPQWACEQLGVRHPGPVGRAGARIAGGTVTRLIRWMLGPDDARRVAGTHR